MGRGRRPGIRTVYGDGDGDDFFFNKHEDGEMKSQVTRG